MDEALDVDNVELLLRCIKIADSRISSSLTKAVRSTSELASTFLSYFSASWVYSKVVSLGVSFLERERRYLCGYKYCLYAYMINYDLNLFPGLFFFFHFFTFL